MTLQEAARSPLWEPFMQFCLEQNTDMENEAVVERAWETWFAGFTCGVVNSSSPQLGKLSEHFDPRAERHALGTWSVLAKDRRR